MDLLVESNVQGTSKQKNFWNIAKDGIYYSKFSGASGTIYTNHYFDFDEYESSKDVYYYYTRVNVAAHLSYDTRTFKVQNYCTKCGFLSETEEFITPANGESTGYIYIYHSFPSSHSGGDHFMYPAVVCTNSYGEIDGTIDVNYSNTWF